MTNIGPSEEQINSIVSILSIGEFKEALEKTDISVSYTHLRAHETRH